MDITKFYENEFLDDLRNLNCTKPNIILRVTEHVPEILKFIQRLVDLEKAYVTKSGCVYFDTQNYHIKSFFSQVQPDTESGSKGNLNNKQIAQSHRY